MILKTLKSVTVGSALVFGLLALNSAGAVEMFLAADKVSVQPGASVYVKILVDSGSDSINAAQGKITFPKNLLQVTNIDRRSSVFSFWAEEPAVSEDGSSIGFIGGSSYGVSGGALEIFNIQFKAVAAGTASIGISGGSVIKSDGKGTDILGNVSGVKIAIGVAPASAPAAASPQPQKITRVPVPISGLPVTPVLRVPSYPLDEWHRHITDAVVFWDLPADVDGVAVLLNKNPNSIPTIVEQELSDGKNLGPISDGIWYIHARFKNKNGFGPVARYKILLDTTPPIPPKASVRFSGEFDPAPYVQFDVHDVLSGLKEIVIFADGLEVGNVSKSPFRLPPLPPGAHSIDVRAFDLAGNSSTSNLIINIQPLPTPLVTFFRQTLKNNEPLIISGKASPDFIVLIKLINHEGKTQFFTQTVANQSGDWEINFGDRLALGKYQLEVSAKNSEGASSYPVISGHIAVRPAPLFKIWKFGVGIGELVMLSGLVIIIILIAGLGRTEFYKTIVSRIYIVVGLAMLLALPYFSPLIIVPVVVSLAGILLLAVGSTLLLPNGKGKAAASFAGSLVTFAVFEYFAIQSYNQLFLDHPLFLINQIIAILFFFAVIYNSLILKELLTGVTREKRGKIGW